jgi:hypothetical protein
VNATWEHLPANSLVTAFGLPGVPTGHNPVDGSVPGALVRNLPGIAAVAPGIGWRSIAADGPSAGGEWNVGDTATLRLNNGHFQFLRDTVGGTINLGGNNATFNTTPVGGAAPAGGFFTPVSGHQVAPGVTQYTTMRYTYTAPAVNFNVPTTIAGVSGLTLEGSVTTNGSFAHAGLVPAVPAGLQNGANVALTGNAPGAPAANRTVALEAARAGIATARADFLTDNAGIAGSVAGDVVAERTEFNALITDANTLRTDALAALDAAAIDAMGDGDLSRVTAISTLRGTIYALTPLTALAVIADGDEILAAAAATAQPLADRLAALTPFFTGANVATFGATTAGVGPAINLEDTIAPGGNINLFAASAGTPVTNTITGATITAPATVVYEMVISQHPTAAQANLMNVRVVSITPIVTDGAVAFDNATIVQTRGTGTVTLTDVSGVANVTAASLTVAPLSGITGIPFVPVYRTTGEAVLFIEQMSFANLGGGPGALGNQANWTLAHPRGTIAAEPGTRLVSATPLPSGRTAVPLNTISVIERLGNQINVGGFFQLSLNNGYRFDNAVTVGNNAPTIVVTEGTGQLNVQFVGFSSDRSIAYFQVVSQVPAAGIRVNPVIINISGLVVSRNQYASYAYLSNNVATLTSRSLNANETATVINAVGGTSIIGGATVGAGVSNYTVDVANFAGYAIYFRPLTDAINPWVPGNPAANFPEVTAAMIGNTRAGQANIVTHRVELTEATVNSIWWERNVRFSLVDADGNGIDGVKIAEVRILDTHNLNYTGPRTFRDDIAVGDLNQSRFSRSFFELRDIRRTNNEVAAGVLLQFTLNTAANFTGNVYIRVDGTGIEESTTFSHAQANHRSAQQFRIREFVAPATISTETTEVTIGYQTFRTADVTFRETAVEGFRRNQYIHVLVQEFAAAGSWGLGDNTIVFNPIQASDVVTANAASTFAWDRVSMQGNRININVSRPSTNVDNLAGVTIRNLAVRINRDAPFGNFDLVVGGNAVTNTFRANTQGYDFVRSAFFPVQGVIFPNYVSVATPGDARTIVNNVVLTPGQNVAVVNGEERMMENAPFICQESHRTLIPLRALMYLMDISSENIIWDEATGQVTILVPGVSPRIFTFTNGSAIMTINGAAITMADENGVQVQAQIQAESGRFFIPLRQLGQAMGISVVWNGTNAIFNPTAAQQVGIQAVPAAELEVQLPADVAPAAPADSE